MQSDSDANVFGDNEPLLYLKVASNVLYVLKTASLVCRCEIAVMAFRQRISCSATDSNRRLAGDNALLLRLGVIS